MAKNKMELDIKFMKQVLKLAEKAYGYTSPNPLVGCIITKNNKIIGKGYHKKAGLPHAEIEALKSCKEDPMGGTLYVNLEPCVHYGKTPPCTDAIIKAGIKKVVIAQKDPNPIVNGKGIEKLKQHNIEVVSGILEEEAKKLNEKFNKFISKQSPFIGIKIAMTLDAKIADTKGYSKWITNEKARAYAHYIRAGYDAIITGTNTIKKDNPLYTVRYYKGENPYRIILSHSCDFDENLKIFNIDDGKTIIMTDNNNISKKFNAEYIFIKSLKNPDDIIEALYNKGISSALVEAGERLSAFFIQNNLVDKLYFFYGNSILGPGKSPFDLLNKRKLNNSIKLKQVEFKTFEDNLLVEGKL